MKHLLTISALLVSSLTMGQMPYNPDSNGDDLIGATDLISVLGLYNTLMVDTSLTCDYEGTNFEEWFTGFYNQSLVLDSVYVEYLLIDSVLTFFAGCPNPVFIETVLERSFIIPIQYSDFSGSEHTVQGQVQYLGMSRNFVTFFNPGNGKYTCWVGDFEIQELTEFEAYSYWSGESISLPFPEYWSLDEDGVQIDWSPSSWAANCEHFRLIPYWSEAE